MSATRIKPITFPWECEIQKPIGNDTWFCLDHVISRSHGQLVIIFFIFYFSKSITNFNVDSFSYHWSQQTRYWKGWKKGNKILPSGYCDYRSLLFHLPLSRAAYYWSAPRTEMFAVLPAKRVFWLLFLVWILKLI